MCCEAVGQLEKVNNTSLKKHPDSCFFLCSFRHSSIDFLVELSDC